MVTNHRILAQEAEIFRCQLSGLKPSFPQSYKIDKDGTIIWFSAGTHHMWNGWVLARKLTEKSIEDKLMHQGMVAVGQAELAMVRNALKRDNENGFTVRGEMLEALEKSCIGLDDLLEDKPESMLYVIMYPTTKEYRMESSNGVVTRVLSNALRFLNYAAAELHINRNDLASKGWIVQPVPSKEFTNQV